MLNELLLPSEDGGPRILEQLAKMVSAKFSTEFDQQKRSLKNILEKYEVPKNCESLLVPTVNQEIWAKFRRGLAHRATGRSPGGPPEGGPQSRNGHKVLKLIKHI